VFEHLDNTVACHVQILARGVPVREVIGREGVHERCVDTFGVEDAQQLA
jgi:hypothetical protein